MYASGQLELKSIDNLLPDFLVFIQRDVNLHFAPFFNLCSTGAGAKTTEKELFFIKFPLAISAIKFKAISRSLS
ncbi:hypothetical protein AB184_22425 [Klebsiella oxytoca]|nr:hypothetical protein AB184_22425 [Klebsiella oxytoca]AKL24783.1 hypothetical protein AB181_22690 [Klebsiella oxytoca]APB45669.1 hypothetical protein AGF18_17745 [Klebsiella oxytoca]